MTSFSFTQFALVLVIVACGVTAKPQNQYAHNSYNKNTGVRNTSVGHRLNNQHQQYQQQHQQEHQQHQQQQQQQHQSQQHFAHQRQPQALRAPLLPPHNPTQFSQRLQQPFPNAIRPFVPITSYSNDVSYDGSYSYAYTTGDGQQQQAQGYLKNAGRKDLEAQSVQGSYSYTSPEGQLITVTYIADENGFRAEGAHLPTPPPIPEAIQKSLALIAQTQPVSAQFNAAYNQPRFHQTGHVPSASGHNYNRYG
ncbi:endocuticle structural glycoprotein SgAbd-1-like [Anopheles maculipalpis]|uniref:endocuticle structural glycoprotein SgAbd-1-like n=1 Tax=Anopheles maculipalpis TaxID=1496333 RepID=UPI0021596F9C|nr:endocuticle structural glycoprotein SgAbd-1-like [Anopheles maculipalpis]